MVTDYFNWSDVLYTASIKVNLKFHEFKEVGPTRNQGGITDKQISSLNRDGGREGGNHPLPAIYDSPLTWCQMGLYSIGLICSSVPFNIMCGGFHVWPWMDKFKSINGFGIRTGCIASHRQLVLPITVVGLGISRQYITINSAPNWGWRWFRAGEMKASHGVS